MSGPDYESELHSADRHLEGSTSAVIVLPRCVQSIADPDVSPVRAKESGIRGRIGVAVREGMIAGEGDTSIGGNGEVWPIRVRPVDSVQPGNPHRASGRDAHPRIELVARSEAGDADRRTPGLPRVTRGDHVNLQVGASIVIEGDIHIAGVRPVAVVDRYDGYLAD